MKTPTNELKIGDRFKLRDVITRKQCIYEITSPVIPITYNQNFSHWVECSCKVVSFTPHKTNCQCGGCNNIKLDKMMWINGDLVDLDN